MDNKILQRLVEYTKLKGISISAFCRKCGLNRSYFHTVKGNFSMATVESIKHQYEDLNITWLSTGEGEMLLHNDNTEASTPLNIPKIAEPKPYEEIAQLREEVERLRGQIVAQQDEIDFYRTAIKRALNGDENR